MFGKFSEQLKKSAKPVNSLVALNAKTFEDLSQHQTELFTGLLSESVKYMESVTHQTEVKGVMAANSAYAQTMRERFASVSKETYSTLSAMSEQVTKVLQQSIDSPVIDTPVPSSAAKVEPAVPKKVTKATEVNPPAVSKSSPTAEAKTEVKAAPAAKKTAAKKPATRTRKASSPTTKAAAAKTASKTNA